MLRLEGIAVSPGYASGFAAVYDYAVERRLESPRCVITPSEIHSECDRLDDAVEQYSESLRAVTTSLLSDPSLVGSAQLLSAHAEMAKEISLLVKQHVGRELVSVEQALEQVIHDFVERLKRLDNSYLREREQDLRDVGRRVMRHLTGSAPWTKVALPPETVMIARELLPSEVVELGDAGVVAIVTEHGGRNSHTFIVAKSMGIPAVTGIADVTERIRPGIRLNVDGEAGIVEIAPSPTSEARFLERKRNYQSLAESFALNEALPCITEDGIEISLLANIGRPDEVKQVTIHNLGGVGLFRTEFLCIDSREPPDLQMQKAVYDQMAKGLDRLPLTIRTLDLGGDKAPPFLLAEGSKHHAALALRGLRFSLVERTLLNTQLHAILEVAQTSEIRILFPMVIGGDDFAQAIAAVNTIAESSGFARKPAVGAMIETPAALYALDEILELADFVALGTNDLTHYMLALDRDSESPDSCTAMHPAVLRAIRQVVSSANEQQCPVSVCGEEAGTVEFACLLVGLGVRILSLSPFRAAHVRDVLRHIRCKDASDIANSALGCRTVQQVRQLLHRFEALQRPLPL